MTRFSVIVPAWQSVEFVDECLRSVRSQEHVDLEVIVVDDGSSDGTGAVVNRHAAEDERVHAIRIPCRSGVGAARNRAMMEASGEYLALLDADDTFADGSVLSELSAVLESHGEPDVLVFDYEYWRPCGLRRFTNLARSVDEGPGEVDVRRRSSLLQFSWVSWNKVYRRQFIDQLDLEFPPGIYEDFVWSVCTILAARRVAALDRICVRYRRCRPESISRKPGDQHFDMFDQFGRIMDFLDRYPEFDSPDARSAIRNSFHTFALDRLENKKVIPPASAPEFLRRIRELVER